MAKKDLTGKLPMHWVWRPHCGFERVDSISYYTSELDRLNDEFKLLKVLFFAF